MNEPDPEGKNPGTMARMRERQRLRLEGKLNPPIRGERGIAQVCAKINGYTLHSLFCKCDWCIPPALKEEMKTWTPFIPELISEMPVTKPKAKRKKKPQGDYVPPKPSTPTKGNKARKGYPEPRSKWSPRCSTCEGRGWIVWQGARRDCPRCSEE